MAGLVREIYIGNIDSGRAAAAQRRLLNGVADSVIPWYTADPPDRPTHWVGNLGRSASVGILRAAALEVGAAQVSGMEGRAILYPFPMAYLGTSSRVRLYILVRYIIPYMYYRYSITEHPAIYARNNYV